MGRWLGLIAMFGASSALGQRAPVTSSYQAAIRQVRDTSAAVTERLGALLALLADHGAVLTAGSTPSTILADSIVTRCPLIPSEERRVVNAAPAESLAALTETLYRGDEPAALRLFARCARFALVDQLPLPEESAVLTGVVRDSTGQPIEAAEVITAGTKRQARSNARGEFLLGWLSPGPHLVFVRAIGYRPRRIPVTLDRTDTLAIEVALEPSAQ